MSTSLAPFGLLSFMLFLAAPMSAKIGFTSQILLKKEIASHNTLLQIRETATERADPPG